MADTAGVLEAPDTALAERNITRGQQNLLAFSKNYANTSELVRMRCRF